MHPLGRKVYLLKRYSTSDSFCTFFLRVFAATNCLAIVYGGTGFLKRNDKVQ